VLEEPWCWESCCVSEASVWAPCAQLSETLILLHFQQGSPTSYGDENTARELGKADEVPIQSPLRAWHFFKTFLSRCAGTLSEGEVAQKISDSLKAHENDERPTEHANRSSTPRKCIAFSSHFSWFPFLTGLHHQIGESEIEMPAPASSPVEFSVESYQAAGWKASGAQAQVLPLPKSCCCALWLSSDAKNTHIVCLAVACRSVKS
jgi:hypothetical protein